MTADGGASAVGQATVTTAVYPPPVAEFGADPLVGPAPLTVSFTNSSTHATDYLWHFGDGQTSSLVDPEHAYTQAGVYTVSLTATGPGGSDTLTRTDYITTAEPVAAGFSAFPPTGGAPLLVQFLNHSTGAVDYRWEFGDSLTSTLTSPTHTYAAVGVYTVSLTATGPGGSDTVSKTNYITVTAAVISREWRLLTATLAPPVVGEQAMAYDPTREVTVLYGGNAGGWPYEQATWEFDGTGWLTVTTTATPTARYGAAMGYAAGEGIILFGGSDESDTALNQTWVYTGSTWTRLSISGPFSRTYHSLADRPGWRGLPFRRQR